MVSTGTLMTGCVRTGRTLYLLSLPGPYTMHKRGMNRALRTGVTAGGQVIGDLRSLGFRLSRLNVDND
jgi:hypothetical protein